MTIIRAQEGDCDLKHIVLRLGAFHMEMSFLGSIGYLMAGSGLQEVLEVVYASNTMGHMLSGKAVSRAVRGHLLVNAALNAMLLANAYKVPVPCKETDDADEMAIQDSVRPAEKTGEDLLPPDLSTARELYEIASTLALDDLCSAEVLAKILEKLDAKKEELSALLRTAKLWTEYMNMVDVLHRFLRAERIGNWNLHLQSVRDMLPYFAASGHSLCAKSAYV